MACHIVQHNNLTQANFGSAQSSKQRLTDCSTGEQSAPKHGRGKAGFVRIKGQQMIDLNRPDPHQIRDEWKTWLDNYIKETKEIINHQTGEEIKCIDCGKLISRRTFLNHKTKLGCKMINPKTKLKNWKK